MSRIPKKVHVVWVGPKAPPEKESRLIINNTKILKDYEFNLWGNENFTSLLPSGEKKLYDYVDEVTRAGKWAYLSDLIKVLALVKFGGWSIDADNEFFEPPTAFERMNFVSGFENYNGTLSPITAVWGAVPHHRFSNIMLSAYQRNSAEDIMSMPNTRWISDILVSSGTRCDNTQQYIDGLDVHLFPDYVFCGPYQPGHTISMHQFSGSWL